MSVVRMHLLPKPLGLIGRCRSARGRGNGAGCSGRTHGAKRLVPICYSSKHGKTSVESAPENKLRTEEFCVEVSGGCASVELHIRDLKLRIALVELRRF